MSLGPGEGLVQVPHGELLWALGSLCALHRLPFDAALTAREHPPPTSHATLVEAGRKLGLRIQEVSLKAREVQRLVFPLIVALRPRDAGAEAPSSPTLGIVTAAKDGQLILFRGGAAGNQPQPLTADEFAAEFEAPLGEGVGKGAGKGKAWLAAPAAPAITDTDAAGVSRSFGFGWFVPELLKHRAVWRDVLLASLALQVTMLFISHALPRGLRVDEVVRIGAKASAEADAVATIVQSTSPVRSKRE